MTVRRTFLWVVALLASFAISAPAALAGDDSDLAAPPVDAASSAPETPVPPPTPSEPAPAELAPAETPPAQPDPPAPAEPAPADPPPAAPAPTEPPPPTPSPSDAAPPSSGSTDPAPSGPGAASPAPSEPAPAEPASPGSASQRPVPAAQQDSGSDAESEATTPDDTPEDGTVPDEPGSDGETQEVIAVAHNRSIVFQVVWQVQEGCRTHCYRTSQSQSVIQWSSTTQTATATAGGNDSAPGGSAAAQNEGITIQFVWQLQIGCVAFCYETSQTQSAEQWAETLQAAIAQGELEAWAENFSETLQYVWQIQEGCQEECYGVSQTQTISQTQSTTQTAAATAGGDDPVTMIVLGPDGVVVLPGWLVALAENQGATIQTIYQHQRAICLEYCEGDVQLQQAIQEALTKQEAIAIAWVGPMPVDEPLAEEPPPAQPPVGQPAPAGPSTPAAPTASASSSAPAVAKLAPRVTARPARKTRPNRSARQGDRRSGAGPNAGESTTFVSRSTTVASESRAVGSEGTAVGSEVTAFAASESSVRVRTRSTDARQTIKGAPKDTIVPSGFDVAPQAATDGDSNGWLLIALLAAGLAIVGTALAPRLTGGNLRGGRR